jgi:hypothetical protein
MIIVYNLGGPVNPGPILTLNIEPEEYWDEVREKGVKLKVEPDGKFGLTD